MAQNSLYQSAIATNIHYITKWNSDGIVLTEFEIVQAAKWNYRKFGYGYVSLDKYIEYKSNKNKVRLYNIDVKLWYSLLRQIFKRDNYTCAYCGCIGGKLEGDHIIPISKGGTNDIENLVTSCRKCNRQKKDKSVEEYLLWRENKNG